MHWTDRHWIHSLIYTMRLLTQQSHPYLVFLLSAELDESSVNIIQRRRGQIRGACPRLTRRLGSMNRTLLGLRYGRRTGWCCGSTRRRQWRTVRQILQRRLHRGSMRVDAVGHHRSVCVGQRARRWPRARSWGCGSWSIWSCGIAVGRADAIGARSC